MTVGKKMAVGFGLIILLALFIGGTGIYKASRVDVGVADLGETHLPLAILAGKMSDNAASQELAAVSYVLHGEDEFVEKFNQYDEAEDKIFEELKKIVSGDQALVDEGWLGLIDDAAGLHNAFAAAAREFIEAGKSKDQALIAKKADELEVVSEKFHAAVDKFDQTNADEANAVKDDALGQSRSSKTIMGMVSIAALLIGLIMAFLIARSITGPISRVVKALNEGADQVASASGQVASASQSLAEGASEQAASLEETSSSLEEMSSMTRQNADNANQANRLMQDANQVVEQANESMAELTDSMDEISKASEETQKIIKTIDEIAFQTNLLALNAAVEAARAGEAGAGFAVVADEVRNLAMRAAEAAKNTANLIEGTVRKVHDGSDLVTRTNEAFSRVAESAGKVGELVGEIDAASSEQAQGIDQINRAVTEMDTVVQQTAANAEESASASGEMNAQAEQMKSVVVDLVGLIGGSAKGSRNGLGSFSKRRTGLGMGKRPGLASPGKRGNGRETAVSPGEKVRPEQVIPLDDADFADF